MQQFAPEEGETIPQEQPPDPEEATPPAEAALNSCIASRKEERRRMSRSLQKLYAMDPRKMEAESRSELGTALFLY